MKSTVDLSRITQLTDMQIRAWTLAEESWEEEGRKKLCGKLMTKGKYTEGKHCKRKAGNGTDHEGFGECVAHGGARGVGRLKGYGIMAHAFAEELDISPWEALLYVIRITAGRVAYCQRVLSGATSDLALEGRVRDDPDAAPLGMTEDGEAVMERNLAWWVDTSERERTLLAKVSKAAIDAGVAAMMVNNAVTEGEKIAAIMMTTLDELEEAGLSDDMLDKARQIMERQLRVMDTGQQAAVAKVIEG